MAGLASSSISPAASMCSGATLKAEGVSDLPGACVGLMDTRQCLQHQEGELLLLVPLLLLVVQRPPGPQVCEHHIELLPGQQHGPTQ